MCKDTDSESLASSLSSDVTCLHCCDLAEENVWSFGSHFGRPACHRSRDGVLPPVSEDRRERQVLAARRVLLRAGGRADVA